MVSADPWKRQCCPNNLTDRSLSKNTACKNIDAILKSKGFCLLHQLLSARLLEPSWKVETGTIEVRNVLIDSWNFKKSLTQVM